MMTTNRDNVITGVPETGRERGALKPAAGLGFNQDEGDGWEQGGSRPSGREFARTTYPAGRGVSGASRSGGGGLAAGPSEERVAVVRATARIDQAAAFGGLKLGSRVRHTRFGDGVVVRLEGQGAQAQVEVHFERLGPKQLMLSMAKLEVIGA